MPTLQTTCCAVAGIVVGTDSSVKRRRQIIATVDIAKAYTAANDSDGAVIFASITRAGVAIVALFIGQWVYVLIAANCMGTVNIASGRLAPFVALLLAFHDAVATSAVTESGIHRSATERRKRKAILIGVAGNGANIDEQACTGGLITLFERASVAIIVAGAGGQFSCHRIAARAGRGKTNKKARIVKTIVSRAFVVVVTGGWR